MLLALRVSKPRNTAAFEYNTRVRHTLKCCQYYCTSQHEVLEYCEYSKYCLEQYQQQKYCKSSKE